jgi:LPS sulfotransferase NodH
MTKDHPSAPPKFVIVTLPRSGSYNLVSLLNSAPDIVCHGEVFKRDAVELGPGHLDKLNLQQEDTEARDAKPMAFLQRLRGVNARKIFGFKMFPEHATRVPPLGAHVLRNPGWRKIFLRRNPIESYASLLRAKQTNVWTVRTTARAHPSRETLHARVTFTPQTFDDHLAFTAWFDKLNARLQAVPGNPLLTVDYEQVADRTALPALLSFVGSAGDAEALISDFDRQFTATLSEGFTNWDDLVRHVRDGGHAAMLPEPA